MMYDVNSISKGSYYTDMIWYMIVLLCTHVKLGITSDKYLYE